MQLLLTSVDHGNISLSTITPMLQHTGIEVLTIPANAESVIQYWIWGTLKMPDTQYPIFLKIGLYEPNTDTDTDVITALVIRTGD